MAHHELDYMTEPELQKLTTAILDSVKAKLPADTGFCVLYFPMGQPGVGHYGANVRRTDMIAALRETADRIERRQEVSRVDFPADH